jgi:hypothetical protein
MQEPRNFALYIGVFEPLTREYLMHIQSSSCDVRACKFLKYPIPEHEGVESPRFAIVNFGVYEDFLRAGTRVIYNKLGDRVRVFKLNSSHPIIDKVTRRPITIVITSVDGRYEICHQAASELQKLGNIRHISTTTTEDGIMKMTFEADYQFSYKNLTIHDTYYSEGGSCKIETLDELLSLSDLITMVKNAQMIFQDLEGTNDLKTKTLRLMGNSKSSTKDARVASIQRGEEKKREEDEDGDNLSCISDDDDSTQEIEFRKGLVGHPQLPLYFDRRISEPLIPQPSETPKPKTTTIDPAILHSLRSIQPNLPLSELMATLEEKTQAITQKNEERLLISLEKLTKKGVIIDQNFFASVKAKVDPKTSSHELLKVGLKIVKTKLRKLKRRDRKKLEKIMEEDLSADEDSAEDQERLKNRAPGCPEAEEMSDFNIENYPTEWVAFVKSLQPGMNDSTSNLLTSNPRGETGSPPAPPRLEVNLIKSEVNPIKKSLKATNKESKLASLPIVETREVRNSKGTISIKESLESDHKMKSEIVYSKEMRGVRATKDKWESMQSHPKIEASPSKEESKKEVGNPTIEERLFRLFPTTSNNDFSNYKVNQMDQVTRGCIVAGLQARLQPE